MKKTIQHIEKKLSVIRKAALSQMLPFTEKPSEERQGDGMEKNNELGATELFSLFTANIIKEELIFTR